MDRCYWQSIIVPKGDGVLNGKHDGLLGRQAGRVFNEMAGVWRTIATSEIRLKLYITGESKLPYPTFDGGRSFSPFPGSHQATSGVAAQPEPRCNRSACAVRTIICATRSCQKLQLPFVDRLVVQARGANCGYGHSISTNHGWMFRTKAGCRRFEHKRIVLVVMRILFVLLYAGTCCQCTDCRCWPCCVVRLSRLLIKTSSFVVY